MIHYLKFIYQFHNTYKVFCRFSETNKTKNDKTSLSGSSQSIKKHIKILKYELCTDNSANMKKENTFEKTVS